MHTETLQQFYERTKQPMPAELASQANVSHFNVKQRTCLNRMTPYNRRDYYKICLIVGQGVHLAGDQETPIEGAGIIFSNPGVPSSYQAISETQSGFYCLFNDTFLLNSIRQEIRYRSALFNPSIQPVIGLDRGRPGAIQSAVQRAGRLTLNHIHLPVRYDQECSANDHTGRYPFAGTGC
jgi:AraC family transcriptional activator of pobA